MKILFIAALVLTSLYGKDTTYHLHKYGDTISKVLIDNNEVASKYDQDSIKSILDYNHLTWNSSRYLPVGHKFYVQGTDEETVLLVDDNGAHYRVELGLFHQSIIRENTAVYSNLSQYILLNARLKKLYLNLRVDNTVYSKDDDQNISKDSSELMFDVAIGKIINFNSINVGVGATYKSILFYTIDALNEVDFGQSNVFGANVFIQRKFSISTTYSVTPELNISKQVNNNAIKGLTSVELSLINQIEALGTQFDIALRYEHSFFEFEGSDLSSRKASVGLGYNF